MISVYDNLYYVMLRLVIFSSELRKAFKSILGRSINYLCDTELIKIDFGFLLSI